MTHVFLSPIVLLSETIWLHSVSRMASSAVLMSTFQCWCKGAGPVMGLCKFQHLDSSSNREYPQQGPIRWLRHKFQKLRKAQGLVTNWCHRLRHFRKDILGAIMSLIGSSVTSLQVVIYDGTWRVLGGCDLLEDEIWSWTSSTDSHSSIVKDFWHCNKILEASILA